MIESTAPRELAREYRTSRRRTKAAEAQAKAARHQARYEESQPRKRRTENGTQASRPTPKTTNQGKSSTTMCTCGLPLSIPCPCGRELKLITQAFMSTRCDSSSDSDDTCSDREDTCSESSRSSSNGEKPSKKGARDSRKPANTEKSAEKSEAKIVQETAQKEVKQVKFKEPELKSAMKEGRKTALPGTIIEYGDDKCRKYCWCPDCFKARCKENEPPHVICYLSQDPTFCVHRGTTFYLV